MKTITVIDNFLKDILQEDPLDISILMILNKLLTIIFLSLAGAMYYWGGKNLAFLYVIPIFVVLNIVISPLKYRVLKKYFYYGEAFRVVMNSAFSFYISAMSTEFPGALFALILLFTYFFQLRIKTAVGFGALLLISSFSGEYLYGNIHSYHNHPIATVYLLFFFLLSITSAFISIAFFSNTKLINKKLRHSLKDVQKSEEIAKAASKAKSEFLANMSHEIRTPLNGITGMNELLLDSDLDTKQKEYATISKISADGLLDIINDILDFSKIEAGKLKIEYIDFDFKKIIYEIISTFKYKAKEKNLELTCNIDPNIPTILNGDPGRIRQFLSNIISNAVKFTHEGQITVDCILKDNLDNKYQVAFKISDTGIGINHESLDVIFEKFVQADGSTTRKYGGTGLGLAITKQLVSLMNGKITVNTQKNNGSTFEIVIDLHHATKKNSQSATDTDTFTTNDSIDKVKKQNFHLLLVEDNIINQVVAKKLLEKYGYLNVDIANNGAIALEKMSDSSYDLIFMDMQMPVMGGVKATEVIRKSNSEIPIIALTANAMEKDRDLCFSAGMNDYLSKPISGKKMVKLLDKYFSKSKTP